MLDRLVGAMAVARLYTSCCLVGTTAVAHTVWMNTEKRSAVDGGGGASCIAATLVGQGVGVCTFAMAMQPQHGGGFSLCGLHNVILGGKFPVISCPPSRAPPPPGGHKHQTRSIQESLYK